MSFENSLARCKVRTSSRAILSDLAARLSVMDRYERRCRGANSQFARSMRRGPVKELCQTRDLLMSYFDYQSREHVQGGPPQFCGCTPLDRRVFAQLRTRMIVRCERALEFVLVGACRIGS